MMNWRASFFGKLGVLSLICAASLSWTVAGLAAPPKQDLAPAGTDILGNITTSTTWGLAGSPYYIKAQEIRVTSGATLTIEPGVKVYIWPDGRIHVDSGSAIIAKGTPSQNIVFDRVSPTYTWKNIRHYAGSTSYYRYVQFLWGGNTEGSLYYEGGTHVLNNCQVKNNKRQGIVANGPVNLRIAGTLFEGNKLKTIWVASGANLTITGSTFSDPDGDWSIYVSNYAPPPTISVSDSNFLRNLGVYNEQYAVSTVDAENNYWGPNHPSTKVGPGVDYSPWLSTGPVDRVGITTPPTVTFTVAPDPSVARPVGTEYTFDASDTTDVEDYLSSLDVCWDWEDDGGGCDSTAISPTHSYASGGWHTARLTVTDTDGLTGTLTQQILSGWVPTATLNFTQTTWAQIEVDADGSDDVEDDPEDLKAYWDWDGDGVWDTGAYSITTVVTHTYSHIGRYWLTLGVEDTEGVVGTQTRVVDIIPPAASASVDGSGGALVSTDGTVTVTLGAGAVSGDAVITHTPWITVPMGYGELPGDFTYQGFGLTAQSLGGQPISGVTGTYTISVEYDLDYYGDVLGLWSDTSMLKLYRWSGSKWVLVPSTIDSGQLIATTDSFGDFALVLEAKKVYLPLVLESY